MNKSQEKTKALKGVHMIGAWKWLHLAALVTLALFLGEAEGWSW
jgi:hypothetical protein